MIYLSLQQFFSGVLCLFSTCYCRPGPLFLSRGLWVWMAFGLVTFYNGNLYFFFLVMTKKLESNNIFMTHTETYSYASH